MRAVCAVKREVNSQTKPKPKPKSRLRCRLLRVARRQREHERHGGSNPDGADGASVVRPRVTAFGVVVGVGFGSRVNVPEGDGALGWVPGQQGVIVAEDGLERL